jgi:hypothetical protein
MPILATQTYTHHIRQRNQLILDLIAFLICLSSCIVKSTNVKTFIAGYQSIQYMEDGAAENRLKHAVTFQPVVVVLFVGKEFSGYLKLTQLKIFPWHSTLSW